MGMDVLRSCYRTRMRFDPSQPTKSSPVTWYFCPAGALPLPVAHSFGSINWYGGSGLPDAPIGELQSSPRPWSNGATPAEATGLVCPVDQSLFLTGAPYLTTPKPTYPDGFPRICNDAVSGLWFDHINAAGVVTCFNVGQSFPFMGFNVKVLPSTNPGSPWFPFINQTYALAKVSNYVWSNPAAGGGLGAAITFQCSGNPASPWFATFGMCAVVAFGSGGAPPGTGFATLSPPAGPSVAQFQIVSWF
jgi:hypothetical protein